MKVDENLLGFHSMGFHGQCIRSQNPLIFSSWEKAPAEMPKTTPSASSTPRENLGKRFLESDSTGGGEMDA
jgi:hypothetical protein